MPVSGCLVWVSPKLWKIAAVAGPGLQAGQPVQVDLGALVDDLLAGRGLDLLRRHGLELHHLAEPVADAGPADRQLRLDQRRRSGRRSRRASSTPSAIAIRCSVPKRLIATGMSPRVGRSNSSAGPAGPHGPGDDLADLQRRVDRHGDPVQLTGALQRGEEVLQIGVREPARHGDQSPSRGHSAVTHAGLRSHSRRRSAGPRRS